MIRLKLFLKRLRQGNYSLLITALALSVTVSLVTARVTQTTEQRINAAAAALLGGDLEVSGHLAIATEFHSKADELGLKSLEITEFPSMLVEEDALLLVRVRALPDDYPLRGHIARSGPDGPDPKTAEGGPRPGEIWAEPDVLSRLGVKLGDTLTVGERSLRLSRRIEDDPVRRNTFESLSPEVLIHQQDLAETRVIGPGSHLTHRIVFSGPEPKVQALKTWLKGRIAEGQTLTDLRDNPPETGQGLKLMRQFVMLASTLSTLLFGVTIGLAARSLARDNRDLVALLRCLGLSRGSLLQLILLETCLLAFPSTLLGAMFGVAILHQLDQWLPALGTLAEPHWPIALTLLAAPLMLLAFALPFLLTVSRTPPQQVLQRSTPALSGLSLGQGLVTLTAFAGLLILISGDPLLSLKVAGLGAALILILGLIGLGVLKAIQPLTRHLPLIPRLGLRRLLSQTETTLIQLGGFAIPIAVMLLMTTLERDLIADVQAEWPNPVPSHFILNLFDSDLTEFQATVQRLNIEAQPLYPITRGRLVRINDEPARLRAQGDRRAEGAINRDLALTSEVRLPSDNQILQGQFDPEDPQRGVSMENELAQRLGVRVGDLLTFEIQGESVSVRVGSLRSVRWRQMTPNFYFIFPKGLIQRFPRTWMTSLGVPGDNPKAPGDLARTFPAASLIDLGHMISQLQGLAETLAGLTRPLWWVSFSACALLLFAALKTSVDERRRDAAVLCLLGASRRLARSLTFAECGALGLFSGGLGVAVAESVRFWLYTQNLELSFQPRIDDWAQTPIVVALGLALLGALATPRTQSAKRHEGAPLR